MTFVDYALIDEVNYRINKRIKYKRETGDNWQKPSETERLGTGDCEDFAIMKAQELVRAGVDPEILSIAVCRTRKSTSLHAVLLVPSRYRKGFFRRTWVDCFYVMDNMSDNLYRFDQTGYTIVRKTKVTKWLT